MCLIIAEAGENHLGDMQLAEKLIDLARTAGADYVKFQYYDAADCAQSDLEKEWFAKVQLDMHKLEHLLAYSRKVGIDFMCTPWDVNKAQDLLALGLKDFKVASFHITDYKMLSFLNKSARKVFLSTGMSTLEEIDATVKLLNKVDLYLLHCVSEYPLDEQNVNLRIMDLLRKKYSVKVGYSDHCLGILACLTAVARGADVIEKHITLSKTLPGTDHILSADPVELKALVEYSRSIQRILGKEDKIITSGELKNKDFFRNRFSHGKLDNFKG